MRRASVICPCQVVSALLSILLQVLLTVGRNVNIAGLPLYQIVQSLAQCMKQLYSMKAQAIKAIILYKRLIIGMVRL